VLKEDDDGREQVRSRLLAIYGRAAVRLSFSGLIRPISTLTFDDGHESLFLMYEISLPSLLAVSVAAPAPAPAAHAAAAYKSIKGGPSLVAAAVFCVRGLCEHALF